MGINTSTTLARAASMLEDYDKGAIVMWCEFASATTDVQVSQTPRRRRSSNLPRCGCLSMLMAAL
jgi:hypothetical protein